MTITSDKRIPRIYGMPESWRDIDVADLKDARARFVDAYPLTPDKLALLIDFCDYWIGAPAWTQPGQHAGAPAVPGLRESIKSVETRDDLRAWLCKAADAGFFPLGG